MDLVTQRKWDRAAKSFDVMNGKGPEWRWGPTKRELFSHMEGKILFLAVGTGLDFEFFPPGQDILGIDISPGMLEKASEKVGKYDGRLELRQMDVHELDLEDGSFDLIVSLSPEAQHHAVEMTRTMATEVEFWNTFDPSLIEGSREVRLEAYRGVRDRLTERMKQRFEMPGAPI